jgi:hypothetical protein
MMAGTLTEDEMVEILEEIAREGGNAAARIAAIRALREIGAGQKPVQQGFDELDAVRQRKLAA